jgi:hypothetical protein
MFPASARLPSSCDRRMARYPSASSASSGSSHSPQTSRASGFAQAFIPQSGQVYFVLLADFFLRKPPAARSFAVDLNAEPLASISTARPEVECVHADARSFIEGFDYEGSGRVLIYADPPYLHATRTSAHRYRHEMTDDDHMLLLARLRLAPASVILSGYPSALYNKRLPDWRTCEFQAMTRGGPRTEKLWLNFEPNAAHWASYAGTDFTDRQRIKMRRNASLGA